MIRFLENHQIDKQRWDKLILSAYLSHPYCFSWYLDIISPGWKAIILNDYEYVMPVSQRKKIGIKYLITPVFLQAHRIFPVAGLNDEIITIIYNYLYKRFRYIDYCTYDKVTLNLCKPLELNNYYLSLGQDYKELWENYSSDCRRNIKIAREYRYKIEKSIGSEELIGLFSKNTGERLSGIKKKDYKRLDQLINYCIKHNLGEIYGIRLQDSLIYGVFLLNIAGRITQLFTSTSKLSRESRCGYLVTDHIIHKYSGENNILDFAGSSIPSIASYIKSYGAVEEKYYRHHINRLPFPIKYLKPSIAR